MSRDAGRRPGAVFQQLLWQIPEVYLGPDGASGVILCCQLCLLHLHDVRDRLHHRDGAQHHAGPQGDGHQGGGPEQPHVGDHRGRVYCLVYHGVLSEVR